MKILLVALLGLGLLQTAQAQAQTPSEAQTQAQTKAQTQTQTPSQVVDAFHQAMRANQPDRVLELLAPEAVVYEQGFAELSRDDWAGKQLGPAIAFAPHTRRKVLRRESRELGDVAWVLTMTRTTVSLAEQTLALVGAETAILRLQPQGWRIVHLHWSAHEEPAEAAPAATP